MKILMLGDYSNLHACLAKELRRRGHEVTVVSDRGGHMKTESDVWLQRPEGLFGGARYLYRIMALLPSWSGYDVVQLINPGFLKLKPGRLRIIYDILRKNNRTVFLTLCGNDHFFVKDCVETDIFRFSEFRIGKEKTPLVNCDPTKESGWLSMANAAYTQHLYATIDGAMSVLPEYDMSARLHMDPEKLIFTNLPIEIENLKFTEMDADGKIRILIGMRSGMEKQKGTARLFELCKQLEEELPETLDVRMVKDLSLDEYLDELRKSHIVIDQLYSYSPATNALQTMALGRITASGGQPEYYEYIQEKSRPVFCLSPVENENLIKDRLRYLITDRKLLKQTALDGRHLVERHNDVRAIAPVFETHWKSRIKRLDINETK